MQEKGVPRPAPSVGQRRKLPHRTDVHPGGELTRFFLDRTRAISYKFTVQFVGRALKVRAEGVHVTVVI